jgi:hypothetical protein
MARMILTQLIKHGLLVSASRRAQCAWVFQSPLWGSGFQCFIHPQSAETKVQSSREASVNGQTVKAPETKKRLRDFLSKNKHWISLVGAVIVFLTFITKEALRDQLKDTVDSVRETQTSFEIREDMNKINKNVNSVAASINEFSERRVKLSDKQSEHIAEMMIELDDRLLEIKDVGDDLAVDLSLAVALQRKTKQKTLKIESEKVRAELEQARQQCLTTIKYEQSGLHREGAVWRADTDEYIEGTLIDQVSASERKMGTLKARIDPIIKTTLTDAQLYRDRYERIYSLATWLSYIFYALGWILTFIGRLFSVGELVPEAE